MRNLKKVLTLVLTVAMLLSVMVVGTGAAFSDQDSIKNKEAVDVCTTLNIIAGMEDGSYRPANNVTRAQMCKMICVALNGGKEPTLGTNATPTFSDVRTDPSSAWAESFIESCNSQGIVSGVGGGRFSPSGSVTGTQAARMLLVALGYRADQEGFTGDAWAINVNTRASAKGLYAGLESIDANAALSRDNAAQMIWNALNAYEVEYVSQLVTVDGNLTSKLVAQDKVVNAQNNAKVTMLEDKYEAKTFIGTFNGNYDTGDAAKKGYIKVAGASFPYDFDLSYIGEEVKVLYRDHKTDGVKNSLDEKDTIYGVYVTGTTDIVKATSDDVEESGTATDNKIKINGTKYDVAPVSSSTDVVITNYGGVNPETVATTNDAEAKFVALGKQNGDTIKFILNDEGEVETAYVTASDLGTVTAVTSTKVSISTLGTIDRDGNDIYSDIAKDDVVTFTRYYDTDAKDAYVVISKAESVSGEVTGYKATDSVTVGGTVYKIYNKITNMPSSVAGETGITSFASTHIGETVDLYLVNGYVKAAVQTTEAASNYSLVINTNGGDKDDSMNQLKIQVLDAAGEKSTLTVNDKSDAGIAVGDIVTYTMKGDEAKVTIKANFDSDKATSTSAFYDKDAKTIEGKVTAGNCVLFVETTANGTVKAGTFKAYNVRSLKDITTASADYTTVVDGGKVVAAYIDLGGKPSGATSDAVYGIVTADVGVVKIDDTNYNQYTIWADKEYTVNVEIGALKKGTIYGFAPSADNMYDNATDFVSVSDADLSTVTVDSTAYTADVAFIKSYDTTDKLLTYYTGCGTQADGVYPGTGETTKAVADDVVVVYVNVDDDEAGDEIGVETNRWVQNGFADAIIIFNSDGAVSYIIVETSGEGNVYDVNS